MDHGRKCSVPCCSGNGYTFHNLPKEPNTQRAWLMFIYEKNIPLKFDTQSCICSNHFTEDSFENLGQFRAGFAMKLVLKRGAIPTVWSSLLPASKSQRKHTTDAACQTDAPSVASHGTQLSLKTLRPHLRSKGIQATVQCQSVAVGTKAPSVCGPLPSTPLKGLRQAKRPRLELEKVEDVSYSGADPQDFTLHPTREDSQEEANVQTCVPKCQNGGVTPSND